jgi:E3 ubiquitin-protein ligase SIAH1
MRPPIKLCANGHKICGICRQKVKECPSCRKKFIDDRNLALEDLARQVKYPCKYWSYGCTETFNYNTIGKHQDICPYIPQKCPAAKLAFGNCSWTGSYSDMKKHLKENHLELCCEYVEGDFKFLYGVCPQLRCFCFIFAHSEIFFSFFEENDNIFYAVLMYVGPAKNAAKYKYKVEFVDEDNTEGITVMHFTKWYNEGLQDIYASDKYGMLCYDQVSRLKDKISNVKYKLEIMRVGK